MSDYEHRFWTRGSEYEDLARQYERNIETYSPEVATGGLNDCWVCGACPWCATKITYKRYTGSSV